MSNKFLTISTTDTLSSLDLCQNSEKSYISGTRLSIYKEALVMCNVVWIMENGSMLCDIWPKFKANTMSSLAHKPL